MERRLNSRAAVLTAWAIVVLLAAGIVGFALYLLLPSASAGNDGSAAVASPAATAAPATGTPAGRATLFGTVDRVEGQVLMLRDRDGAVTRVVVRNGASVVQVHRNGNPPAQAMALADLQPGQRVSVDGERMVDGSVAAVLVRVFEPR